MAQLADTQPELPEPTGEKATRAEDEREPLLHLEGFTKTFGHVQALIDVSLTVRAGEVVALVGDNGAGKSTLIKAISGVAPADAGTLWFCGREVTVSTPLDSANLGIAVVYQDLALCDNLSVAGNLFLGSEWLVGPFLDKAGMEVRARELLTSIGATTIQSFDSEVGLLSGGQRQSVSIARSLLGDPRLVILDEPTAALGVTQTEQVLKTIVRLRDRGLGVLLVSHNLSNVFSVADRVEVLRLGRNGGSFVGEASHQNAVVAAITGATVEGARVDQTAGGEK